MSVPMTSSYRERQNAKGQMNGDITS